MTDCPNSDAEKAALAEALREARRYVKGMGPYREIEATIDAVLADLSPAAKEILEKAQAHDAMKRENERLRTALIEPINDVRGKPTLQGCKACRNLWRKDGPEKHFNGCVLATATVERKVS